MCGKLKKVILALLLVSWMALIFALSAETALESDKTSAGFTFRVFSIIYPDFDEKTPDEQQQIIEDFSFIVRKSAHFSIYFFLGVLCVSNLMLYKVRMRSKLILSQIISTLYAVSDEIHQLFVPGRAGQIRDVLIDSCGAFIGIILFAMIYINRNRIKNSSVLYSERGVRMLRKKELKRSNQELFERLGDANLRADEYKTELQSAQERIKDLEAEKNILTTECDELKVRVAELEKLYEQTEAKLKLAEQSVLVSAEIKAEPLKEEYKLETVLPEETLPEPVLEEKTQEELLNDMIESISPSVSETVSEIKTVSEPTPKMSDAIYHSTQKPEVLTEPDDDTVSYASQVIGRIVVSAAKFAGELSVGADVDKKELVNLILGRCEVAKAEILDVAVCEADAERKKTMINNISEQAIEYFGNVAAQI